MRGTGYAIAEIVWWMLAAGAIGVAVGWILHGVFGGGARLREAETKLEEQRQRYARVSGALGEWKRKVGAMETDIEAKTEDLATVRNLNEELETSLAATRTELEEVTATMEDRDLEIQRLTGAAGEEVAAPTPDPEPARLRTQVADLESSLRSANRELSKLRVADAALRVEADENAGRVAALEAARAFDEPETGASATAPADTESPQAESPGARPADLEALAAAEEANSSNLADSSPTDSSPADSSPANSNPADSNPEESDPAESDRQPDH